MDARSSETDLGPFDPHETRPHVGHGNTVAAWTAVTIIIVGCLVGALAFPLKAPWLFWTACAIAVIGLGVGKVLSMAGYGALPKYTEQAPTRTHAEGPSWSEHDR